MHYVKKVTKRYTNFTPNEIKLYLIEFKRCVKENKYIIAKNENRQKNIDFIEEYRIDTKKEKEILLSVEYTDFCYVVDNEKEAYAHEKLYIFCKHCELDNWGSLETIEIYIKLNMTQTKRGDDFMIVISFHKKNKHLEFLFK